MTQEQPPFVRVFETVETQISQLATTVRAQGIVESFDGSKPKHFKNWIKSIEKYAIIAYQSIHDSGSDFLKRYLSANRNHSWDQENRN